MDPRKQRENERKFGDWSDLSGGGRRYFYAVAGHHGWTARYVKEVDADENTVRFYQEIFDQASRRVEIHDKYPEDKGHQNV